MRRTAFCVGLVGGLLACSKVDTGASAPSPPAQPHVDPVAEAAAKAEADASAAAAADVEKKKQRMAALFDQAEKAESKTDMRPALKLYEEVCAEGGQDGCAMEGLLLSAGEARIPSDTTRALALVTKACADGNQSGCLLAGEIYWHGDAKAHVPKDFTKAESFLSPACAANSAEGCALLGTLEDLGDGQRFPQDFQRASDFYSKACGLGDQDSCKWATNVRWQVAVSAGTIWRAYHDNEVAADNLYKDKEFEVTGVLDSIRKDFADDVVLELKSPNPFMKTSAYVASSELAKAATLRNGQKILLTCTGDGMVIGIPNLTHCVIRDVK